MPTNLERYRNDLAALIDQGGNLQNAMASECFNDEFKKGVKEAFKTTKEQNDFLNKIPSFKEAYQAWYSEALATVRFFIPDRVDDFVKLYAKPKSRKDITYENYVIEDYLQSLRVTRLGDKVVGPDAAMPRFQQQLSIVRSIKKRFESSLFDIKRLVQADLFDSELDAAKDLNAKGYMRGAGAMAGVVLESHLSQVCESHKILVSRKRPGIGDFNELLKTKNVIELHDWRFIQRLGDLRNLCDHAKKMDPTTEQIDELIAGVAKVMKTIF